MFKLLHRIKISKDFSEYERNIEKLFKDQNKIEAAVLAILFFFISAPLAFTATLMLLEPTWDDILIGTIFTLCYLIFLRWFIKKFKEEIKDFKDYVTAQWYSSAYTFKGKAILLEDFKKIEEENKKLYFCITTKHCKGFCYAISFNILKTLKKGSIKFIAVRCTKVDGHKEKYTMHVMYVNNDWCFDTFTQRQYLLEEHIKLYEAKEYISFSYEDIEGKTYEQFREDNNQALKKWCEENDCYQIWKED